MGVVFRGKLQKAKCVISSLVRRRTKLVCVLRLCETFLFLPAREQEGTTGEGFLEVDWLQYELSYGSSGGWWGILPSPDLISLGSLGQVGLVIKVEKLSGHSAPLCSRKGKALLRRELENSLDGGYQLPRLANEGKHG